MTTKIPECVILNAQREVYNILAERNAAVQKVAETENALERAKIILGHNEEILQEMCAFLDEVSPIEKDWNWLEEIEGSKE